MVSTGEERVSSGQILTGRFFLFRPVLPEVVEDVGFDGAAQSDDLVGAGDVPERPGLLQPLADQAAAGALNHAGADGHAGGAVPRIVQFREEVLKVGRSLAGLPVAGRVRLELVDGWR